VYVFFADLTEEEKQLLAKILQFKQQLLLDIQVSLQLCFTNMYIYVEKFLQ